uniref:Uncharacterized protein n=1 Tax=Trichuris muris TaxID=70415 RepID=A0A5S6R497_TRIMR
MTENAIYCRKCGAYLSGKGGRIMPRCHRRPERNVLHPFRIIGMKALCLFLVLCIFVAAMHEANSLPGALGYNRGIDRMTRQRERAAFRAGKRVGMSIARRRRGRPFLRIG